MVDALGRLSGEQFGGRGRQSPGTIDPLLLADQLASEPERDIQVATVGVTPVKPLTGASPFSRPLYGPLDGKALKPSSRPDQRSSVCSPPQMEFRAVAR